MVNEDLFNPELFHDPIDLRNTKREDLLSFYEKMMGIRLAEEKLADEIINNNIKCPVHLSIGQESIATGISHSLDLKVDKAFGNHRSHSHFLSMGGTFHSLFSECLGKVTGSSKGMGGSMHLYGEEFGFMGSVPIVSGTIPLAVGAGFALKYNNVKGIGIAYFGDGACEEGILHESLNLAAVMDIPVLFVCENNLYSSHLFIDERQKKKSVSRFAEAAGVQSIVIDGNDVCLVADTMQKARKEMLNSNKPFFLECITYRWRGHVGPSEDNDVGVDRKGNLSTWKKRDPIHRLTCSAINNKILKQSEFDEINNKIRLDIETSWNQALSDPYPSKSQLLNTVYKSS